MIGIIVGLFFAALQYAYYRFGYRHGYRNGVLEGYMVGKFSGQVTRVHREYPAAQKIADELEATVVWKHALNEPIKGEG